MGRWDLFSLLWFAILSASLAQPSFSATAPCYYDEKPARDGAFDEYIDGVLFAARDYYDEWRQQLMRPVCHGVLGIRLHRIALTPEKARVFRWLGSLRERHQDPGCLGQDHLMTVRSLAAHLRQETALEERVRFRYYRWTEEHFLAFERGMLERIDDLQGAFSTQVEGFHADRKPPTFYEMQRLVEQYLDVWVLGALLQVEGERYLSVFPLPAVHREHLIERQQDPLAGVSDCRMAIVRMLDPRYRW